MNTKLIIAFCVSSLISTSFASNPLLKQLTISHPTANPVTAANQPYVDFSGVWNAHCQGNKNVTVAIKNDATHFSIATNEDGVRNFEMNNNILTSTHSEESRSAVINTSASWQDEHNTLVTTEVE